MSYFISQDDLDRAMDEERDRLFTVIGRALYELEHRFSLLINVGFTKSDPAKKIKKGDKKMSKAKTLIEKLWIIADKSDNKELVDITKELESYVTKTENFTEELKGLSEKIKGLQEKVGKREEEKKIEEKEEKKQD